MRNPWLARAILIAVHIGSLFPLILLVADFQTVNPIQAITQRSGKAALILLVLCLACTPLNTLFGWKWANSLRKPLGLYSFLYVCLHLATFVILDYGLDLGFIWQAVVEKRYVVAGFAGFLLLLPLALTSTKAAQRYLGKNWKRLHRLIYPAAIIAVLHFLWLSKFWSEPFVYAVIVGVLLLLRLPFLRRSIVAWRRPAKAPAKQLEDTPSS